MKINVTQVILNNHKREASKGFSMWDIYHMKMLNTKEEKDLNKKAEEEQIESAYNLNLKSY